MMEREPKDPMNDANETRVDEMEDESRVSLASDSRGNSRRNAEDQAEDEVEDSEDRIEIEAIPEGDENALEDALPASGDAAAAGGAGSARREQPLSSGTAIEEIRSLHAERDRLYEACLRTTADFDNYRKRIERERQEFREYAQESLIRQLLPVLDNFERALDSLPSDLPRGFVEGVRLIHKQLRDVLFKQGLSLIEGTGQMFDPHLHEAVQTEVRTDVPHHQVLEEIVKGYRLGKRVLRPAMVKVSVRPEEGVSETETETETETENENAGQEEPS